MKISEILALFEAARIVVGDAEVGVSGCYGAITFNVEEIVVNKEDGKVIIQTDLMTG